MKIIHTILIPILLSSPFHLKAQEFKPSKNIYAGPTMKIIPHQEASTGILVGLSGNKMLNSDRFELGFGILRNINTMTSDDREGYEFESFYHAFFGGAWNLNRSLKIVNIQLKTDLGASLIEQNAGLNSDNRSMGTIGFFSISPGLYIITQPINGVRINSGISYMLNTGSVKEAVFRRPIFDIGIQVGF